MAAIGDKILPTDQSMEDSMFAMLNLNPGPPSVGAVPSANFSRPSASPYTNRLASASNILGYISYLNTWLSTANANSQATPPTNFAKEDYLLRMNPRIDKYPWPHGQRWVYVMFIISYQDGIGGTGGTGPTQPAIGYNTITLGSGGAFGSVAFAPDVFFIVQWNRNTTLNVTLTSGPTTPNANVQGQGYPSGNTATMSFTLTSRNLLSGLDGTLTQADDDPYTPSFMQLDVINPAFSFTGSGSTVWNTPQSRLRANNYGNFWQPRALPGLSGTQIFPSIVNPFGGVGNFFTRSTFSHPLGLVQSCSWLVGSWGWSPEINDSSLTT
jgi:hypothetical protein